MNRERSQVIELRLNRAEEMFVLAQTDLFSEYRNYLTGVEYCISLLRSQRIWRPVRLQLSLPPGESDNALDGRLSAARGAAGRPAVAVGRRSHRGARIPPGDLRGQAGRPLRQYRARHHGVGAGVGG